MLALRLCGTGRTPEHGLNADFSQHMVRPGNKVGRTCQKVWPDARCPCPPKVSWNLRPVSKSMSGVRSWLRLALPAAAEIVSLCLETAHAHGGECEAGYSVA